MKTMEKDGIHANYDQVVQNDINVNVDVQESETISQGKKILKLM